MLANHGKVCKHREGWSGAGAGVGVGVGYALAGAAGVPRELGWGLQSVGIGVARDLSWSTQGAALGVQGASVGLPQRMLEFIGRGPMLEIIQGRYIQGSGVRGIEINTEGARRAR